MRSNNNPVCKQRIVAGVYTAKKNKISVLMANPTPQHFTVKPNSFIGVIDELDENSPRPWAPSKEDIPLDAKRTPWSDADSTQQFQNFISNFRLHHVKPSERTVLEKLLWEKRKAFAKNVAEVGLFNKEQFAIPFKPGAAPTFAKQHLVAQRMQKPLATFVHNLYKNKIIRDGS